MAKTDNLNDFMTDLADSIREATGETESINAQSFSTRITGLGTGKQDKLVSGENIKTINGESILGSGNISISSGSGTITGVSANGTSVATSGVANIPAATTSKYGVTKLNSSTSSTSTTEAATPSAVKSAYDLANSYKGTVTGVKINGATKNPSSGVVDLGTVITAHQDISGKQDKLVSGTNIKTINGTSILGSGDITISGGSSSGSGAYAEVNHGTSDTAFTLTPNTFHVWGEVSELTLTLGDETAGVANEFLFQFTSGSTPTSLTLPDDIKWANDSAPTIAENKIYQISVLKGLASCLEFEHNVKTLITFNIDGTESTALQDMTWKEWVGSEYNRFGYISVVDSKVTHIYTENQLFTSAGNAVKGTDVIEQITYTFNNPWA